MRMSDLLLLSIRHSANYLPLNLILQQGFERETPRFRRSWDALSQPIV
jgi:hypothetical protein